MGRRLADGNGEGDELTAFLITLGAGLATTVGASLAFCLPIHNSWLFATCLALSAGVMTQVSYQEIFSKAEEEFLAEGFEEPHAFTLATLVFFGGIIISAGLEFFSHAVLKRDCCDPDCPAPAATGEQPAEQPPAEAAEATPRKDSGKDKAEMVQMAAFSGVAIALHNFPEGLATFVATLADPAFGATLGIAIAIHNIPEGLAVAVPVLKATGSKLQAFLWAFLSGVFEPLGGLLGWLVLKEVIGPVSYAILFGIIGGVMVHISFRKLLPTALKYDPKNAVTSYAFFAGMAIMSGSLVAFSY